MDVSWGMIEGKISASFLQHQIGAFSNNRLSQGTEEVLMQLTRII